MSTTEAAMTVHVVKPAMEDEDTFLARLTDELHRQFGIEHLTVQIERGAGAACKLAPENVV